MIYGFDRSNGHDYSVLAIKEYGALVTMIIGDTPAKAQQIEEILELNRRRIILLDAE